MTSGGLSTWFMCVTISVIGLLILVSIALNAASLHIINKRFNEIKNNDGTQHLTTDPSITTSTTSHSSLNLTLAELVHIADVMGHLKELQRIAIAENGTRAINTRGFNRTLDYITDYLSANTNYNVTKRYFPIRNFQLARNPIFVSSINGAISNYIYSTDLSKADFYHIVYSTSANFSDYVSLTAIPNSGCSDADWIVANPPPASRAVLIKRGICDFEQKALLAANYNVTALLIYNDGVSPDRVQPIAISLDQRNALPALFLSSNLGQALADASVNLSVNASVRIVIDLIDIPPYPVGNICADTPTGDITQTIVVGSHSDSVPAGPGINDNGSGSAANLALAVALARLFQTSSYAKYQYRIRFCWWGAEEIGLLGSDFYIKQAKNSTVPGERIADNLVNLNFDMLGSPNYIFGIYDGRTLGNVTPSTAIPGSRKITELFHEWFNMQNLPRDNIPLHGGSDYVPFLAAGIAIGGLVSGAGTIKRQEQCDRYAVLLGPDPTCIPNAALDACYHKACDSIWNINVFAYEKMVQAAAYALEYMARQENLKEWLYPTAEIGRLNQQSQEQSKFNSVNEYFGMPYF
ncbi:unnamed protein product [Rotaria sp. Silwood2]|nr:unnamed protein product [Rotaria sp. Silwood2]CAF4356361.1 unnamed protein product [Rotaria sp. Silwood2]